MLLIIGAEPSGLGAAVQLERRVCLRFPLSERRSGKMVRGRCMGDSKLAAYEMGFVAMSKAWLINRSDVGIQGHHTEG